MQVLQSQINPEVSTEFWYFKLPFEKNYFLEHYVDNKIISSSFYEC